MKTVSSKGVPTLQSVIDRISGRLESTDLISSMSVFDPHHLPNEEKLGDYGTGKVKTLTDFYGSVQEVHFDGNKIKVFQSLILILMLKIQNLSGNCFVDLFVQHKDSSLQQVLSTLLSSADLSAAFPNLVKLVILIVLPVTTATAEWTFSSMKLIKTRLWSRMGENTLEHAMCICIEGRDQLPNDTLEVVIDHYKHAKRQKLALWTV